MIRTATVVIALGGLALAACASRAPKVGTVETTSAPVRKDLEDAWARYARAAALSEHGRVDEAVDAFRSAEAGFEGLDRRGKAIAIYGRARVLTDVGRCDEATKAYAAYADFVRGTDARAADMALRNAEACTAPKGAEIERWRDDGWSAYERAVALAERGRTDEAIAAYDEAARAFATVDERARSLAVYGRAHWLDMAGRCFAARRAYAEYADLVRATQPGDAASAERLAAECTSP